MQRPPKPSCWPAFCCANCIEESSRHLKYSCPLDPVHESKNRGDHNLPTSFRCRRPYQFEATASIPPRLSPVLMPWGLGIRMHRRNGGRWKQAGIRVPSDPPEQDWEPTELMFRLALHRFRSNLLLYGVRILYIDTKTLNTRDTL